ncbi:MAG TPA: hypothetical protein VEI04_05135 [Syntrophobacteria bacterium]|nr:hypothetical protein [Syntrophobacteria bacterium]
MKKPPLGHLALCPGRSKPWVRAHLLLILLLAAISCGQEPARHESLEVSFRDVAVKAEAVAQIVPLVALSHQADQAHLTPALQSLFTYLAETPLAQLTRTPAHAQGTWRIEKVFILDDFVAVQLTEGHYLETLLFSQHSQGWRLMARIRPEDHA